MTPALRYEAQPRVLAQPGESLEYHPATEVLQAELNAVLFLQLELLRDLCYELCNGVDRWRDQKNCGLSVRRRLGFVQANPTGYKFISIEQQEFSPCLNPSSSAI